MAQIPDPQDLPVFECESDGRYSLEIVAEMSGVATDVILRYREEGLVHSVSDERATVPEFDLETVRRLRQIEHLRATLDANEASLRLILNLLGEVERLRSDRYRRPV